MSLDLEILTPGQTILHVPVIAVQAGDASGRFGLLPGHEDFLTVLQPCVLHYRTEDERERYAAVDGGILMLKQGRITLATNDAVLADELEQVAGAAAGMLETRRAEEKSARAAFAELEISLLHELNKAGKER